MERAPETTSKGISPATAFAVVAAVLVAIGLTWFFVRPHSPELIPTPADPTPADFSLTNEEAIARFKELDALKIRLYETADLSLIDGLFTTDSPVLEIVKRDLKKLSDSSIDFRSEYDTQDVTVVSNGAEEIRIKQNVVVRPRLLNAGGRNVAETTKQRQEVLWVLQLEGDEWLIHKTVVISAQTA